MMKCRNPFKQVNYFNSDLVNNIYFNDVKEQFRKPNELKNKIITFLIKNSHKGLILRHRRPQIKHALPQMPSDTVNNKVCRLIAGTDIFYKPGRRKSILLNYPFYLFTIYKSLFLQLLHSRQGHI